MSYRRVGLSVGLVLWIMVVFSCYYAYHHFEIVPFKTSIFGWALNLLTIAALLSVATALGRLSLRSIGLQTSSLAESLVFGAAIGYGLLATVVLLLGLVGVLSKTLIWGSFLLLVLAALPEMRCMIKQAVPTLRGYEWSRLLVWDFDMFLRLCLGTCLAMGLLLASVPPFSWDALVVHLVVPQNALQHGAISIGNEHAQIFSLRPILQHMLSTLGMGIRGDIMPKLVHFSFALLTVLAVYALASHHFRCSPLLGASLFYLTPVVQLIAPWAYVDIGVTLYSTTAVYALLNWLRDDDSRWVLVASSCAAWAGWVKSNGLFVAAFAVLFMLHQLVRSHRTWRRRLAVFAGFALVGILVSVPWMAANYLLQAPVLGQAQTGLVRSVSSAMRQSSSPASPQGSQGSDPLSADRTTVMGAASYLALPWSMTMKGYEGRYEYDGEIGPLFLMLLPAWPLLWRDRKNRILMSCVLLMFLLWLGRLQGARLQNRLLMPAFPLLGIMTACAIERLRDFALPRLSPHVFARLVLALVFVVAVVNQLILTSKFSPGTFILGGRNRSEYLAYVFDTFYFNSPGYYEAMQHANAVLPEQAKVGVLWPEERVYYMPRPYVVNPFPVGASSEAMWEASRSAGLTHLLVHRAGLDFKLNRSDDLRLDREAIARYIQQLDMLVTTHGRLVPSASTDYELYELVYPQ